MKPNSILREVSSCQSLFCIFCFARSALLLVIKIVGDKNLIPIFMQDGENDSGADEDGKSKFKRRPRPEPLIIPPPKASSFIPPSLYPSITSYQSNLRSPVRLPENFHAPPPYTPPPILSPVRGGSGLYFSAFLTNMASNQILPPPVTPKSATRSLLRTGMFLLLL